MSLVVDDVDVAGVMGCDCSACMRARRQARAVPSRRQAVERAEALLDRFLTDDQREEWIAQRSILVKGSAKHWFRLRPRRSGSHDAVVRQDGLGICVWPVGLDIPADWALAMMLRIETDEWKVVDSGCHGPGRIFGDRPKGKRIGKRPIIRGLA